MKQVLLSALFTGLLCLGSTAFAQTAKPTNKLKTARHTPSSTKRATGTQTMTNSDNQAVVDNPVHSETTDDRLYLNHPFFNGDARWTNVDSLYKHGDFPWALVSKNPDNFRYDDASGSWQTNNPELLGKTNQSR